MKNSKVLGFTLIELLAVIVILVIILAIAVPGISSIIRSSTKNSFESDAKMVIKAIEYKTLEDEGFDPLTISRENMQDQIKVSNVNYEQVTLSMVNGKVKVVLVGQGKWDGLTAYGTFKNMRVVNSDDYDEVPPVITILGDNPMIVSRGDTYVEPGATATDLKDGDLTSSIVITGTVNVNVLGTYTITYTVSDNFENTASATRTVSVEKNGNEPVLATGMTPIKWDGNAWVDTTVEDNDWYDYTTTDKKWANARTADGSMWVWIPRYAYQIASGYHTNTTGTINIKFLKNTTNTTSDGTAIATTPTYSGSVQTNYVAHPAFTFGTTELPGIWVGKFESTGTTASVSIKPGITAIYNKTVSTFYSAGRGMETNSMYGWGTSGAGIDTHMMKNSEWGAVAYFSKSAYGKSSEIWINNSSAELTGCAGDSVTAASYEGCQYAYNTANGQQISTTGNIYGVYDMSGGLDEYVMGNYNNEIVNSGFASVAAIEDKYIDRYTGYSASKFGDAVYETSSGSGGANTSWYSDNSVMIGSTVPWLRRGGRGGQYNDGTGAGIFSFGNYGGSATYFGFRVTLLVGTGL